MRRMLRTYRHPSLLKWALRVVGAEAEVEVGLGWPLALAFGDSSMAGTQPCH